MKRWIDGLEDALAGAAAKAWAVVAARAVANAHDLVNARFAGMLLAVPLLAGLSAPLLFADVVVINTYIVDYALPLDTSLRWWHGQVPHLDYHTPIGAAYWLMQGLAVELTGLSAKSPVIANFIAAAVLALSGGLLARQRLSGGLGGLFLFAVLMIVISPRSTGDLPGQVSFLGAYNKVALACLAILLMTFFLEPRRPRHAIIAGAEVAATGLLLVWLFYLKVNVAAIAVAGGIVALYYAPANRRLTLAAFAVAAAAVGLVGMTAGINHAYLADIAQASGSVSLLRGVKVIEDLVAGLPLLVILALALAGYWRRSQAPYAVKVSNLIITLGLVVASLITMNQVHDHAWPLVFAILILLAQRALAESSQAFVPPTVAAFLLVAYTVFADMSAVVIYVNGQRDSAVLRYCDDASRPACAIGVATFDAWVAPRLAPLPTTASEPVEAEASLAQMYEFCESHEYCVWWMLNEQLYRHLNRVIEPGDRPLFLGFMNWLPYYYGLEPPRHVLAWMDIDRNLSLASHPEPRRMLSDVTLVVVPRIRSDVGYFADLETIYGETISQMFEEIDRSEVWSIWRRREP